MKQVTRHEIEYNFRSRNVISSFIPLLKEAKASDALGSFTKKNRYHRGVDEVVYQFEIKDTDDKTLAKNVVGKFDIIVNQSYLNNNDPVLKELDWFYSKEISLNYVNKRLIRQTHLKKVGLAIGAATFVLVTGYCARGPITSFIKREEAIYQKQMEAQEEANRRHQLEQLQREFFENYEENKDKYIEENKSNLDRLIEESSQSMSQK